MGKMSRDKGKRGELEGAAEWQRLFGVEMRRSQQFCGRSPESDDVIGQPGVAIEVKRREKLNVPDAVERAVEDAASDKVAVVLHRSSRRPWLVSLRLEDLPQLVTTLYLTLAGKDRE